MLRGHVEDIVDRFLLRLLFIYAALILHNCVERFAIIAPLVSILVQQPQGDT